MARRAFVVIGIVVAALAFAVAAPVVPDGTRTGTQTLTWEASGNSLDACATVDFTAELSADVAHPVIDLGWIRAAKDLTITDMFATTTIDPLCGPVEIHRAHVLINPDVCNGEFGFADGDFEVPNMEWRPLCERGGVYFLGAAEMGAGYDATFTSDRPQLARGGGLTTSAEFCAPVTSSFEFQAGSTADNVAPRPESAELCLAVR